MVSINGYVCDVKPAEVLANYARDVESNVDKDMVTLILIMVSILFTVPVVICTIVCNMPGFINDASNSSDEKAMIVIVCLLVWVTLIIAMSPKRLYYASCLYKLVKQNPGWNELANMLYKDEICLDDEIKIMCYLSACSYYKIFLNTDDNILTFHIYDNEGKLRVIEYDKTMIEPTDVAQPEYNLHIGINYIVLTV